MIVARGEGKQREYTYETWVEDLRGIVWNAFSREGRTIEDIATVANLHFRTVEKFAWGETKRPALRTAFELARAVGFRIPFIPIGSRVQPDEPDLGWTRSMIKSRS